MTDRPLTLLCVHAHPDDEALFTGGIEAHYADRGVRQVLVTCTNGALGFDGHGRGSREAGFDGGAVAATRAAELEASAAILGIDRLIQLGYADSGMAGWPENEHRDAFVNQPRDEVVARLVEILEQERPQVVVTYDANGFYGHPDHIAAHEVTVAAVEACGIPDKLYTVAIPESALAGFVELAEHGGMDLPDWIADGLVVGTPDDLVQTTIDCTDVVDRKHRALAAHATQTDNADLVAMEPELFDAIFGTEMFVRMLDRTGAPLPESDLFSGVADTGSSVGS
jgi:LmbE family N-acetylglucosaminyl deacetylase